MWKWLLLLFALLMLAFVALAAVVALLALSPDAPATQPTVAPVPAPAPLIPRPKPKPRPWDNCSAPVGADEGDEKAHALFVPASIRRFCRNPDGSCVQCSISMCGYDQNYPEASMLLWDTEYGRAERGGGTAQRTSGYAQKRGMRCFNVTGSEVYDYMKWACATGRGAAIGYGGGHFQTLVGHDPKTNSWWVCDNNSTDRITKYDDAAFRRLHEASGKWVVILDVPPRPGMPWQYVEWWK